MSTLQRTLVLAAAVVASLAPVPARGQPVAVVSDTLLDFGEVPVSVSATREFTIGNAGDVQLVVVDVFADAAAEFGCDPRVFGVDPGESQTVTVTYTPGTVGPDSSTVNIATWYGDFDTLRVAVRGRGVESVPRISISTDTVTATVLRWKTTVDTLTITNEGADELSWSAALDPDAIWLSVVPADGSIAGRESTDVEFRYDTSFLFAGTFTTTVALVSNDPSRPSVPVTVVLTIESYPVVEIEPNPLDFGKAPVGATVEQSLYVHNDGSEILYVNNIARDTPELYVSPSAFYVFPGETQVLTVSLTAESVGPFAGTISIPSNDPNAVTTEIPVLADVGELPHVVLSTDTIAVALSYGDSTTRVVTIGNTGGYPLTWSAQDAVSWVDVTPASGTVDDGASAGVDVVFRCVVPAGMYDTGLVFTTSDLDNPEVTVPVRLNALPTPLITVSTDALDVPGCFVDKSATAVLTLTDVGNIPVSVLDAYTTSAEFVVTRIDSLLQTGGSGEVEVECTPVAEGVRTGTLYIVNTSINADTLAVALTGRGYAPFEITVSSDSMAVTAGENMWREEALTAANPTRFQQWVRVSAWGVPPAAAASGPDAEQQSAYPPPLFYSNFESFDFSGWNDAGSGSTKEFPTDAPESIVSYRERGATGGHQTGIYTLLPGVQVRAMSFWVKPGQTNKLANYVAIQDPRGYEALTFYAMDSGTFYLNAGRGGDNTFPYEARRWYHIEYRNFDWTAKTFDYYIDGSLVKAGVSLRNPSRVASFGRIDLYSFSIGATASWDDIWIDWAQTPEWLSYSPRLLRVDALGSADVQLRVRTTGLAPGVHEGVVALATASNETPLIEVPVTVTVDSLVTGVTGGAPPAATALHPCVPNPFNPATTIAFDLSRRARVTLEVYDVSGAVMATLLDRPLPAGRYTATWNGAGAASGVYFCRLRAGSVTQTQKMVLLK